ncbi:MAG: aryl-sulfate sulfohydrolase [Flavobacteriaceae bacterium TMED42]|nr:MAG: aryl-sulfate sulfohydrolase [Flavobacteriaceae bacterium TMED42]
MKKQLNISAILFQLLVLITLSSCSTENKHLNQPNIVLINIDDMGWNDISFMGSEYYNTPHIDALADQSLVFTQGYAASANCAPSRASIHSGKWTTRHQIYTVANSDRGKSSDRKLIPIKNTTVLDKKFTILSQKLKQQGYITCHSGKWHISDDPLEYGFDVNIAGGPQGAPGSYYPPFGNNSKQIKVEKGKSEYLTDLIMENTLLFLDDVKGPFFLNYSPYAVHTPIHPVDSLLYKYENKPPYKGQKNPRYATMIENLDRNIGLLVDKLKKRKLFDNTFIIFTSDNGGYFGKITMQKPLRAGKGSYYEGGIRVPFFFLWKDKISPGKDTQTPISHLDIFPTLMDLVGDHSMEKELDGHSLLPLTTKNTSLKERSFFWHFPIYLQGYDIKYNENRDSLFRTRPGSVIRKGDWKLHYYFEDKDVEVFNLKEDIGERNNLAEVNKAKKQELLDELKYWWNKTDAPIPTEANPLYQAR